MIGVGTLRRLAGEIRRDVAAAHERIKLQAKRTPFVTSRQVDELTGAKVFFKCENFQKAGAFKARGGKMLMWHGLSDAAIIATSST